MIRITLGVNRLDPALNSRSSCFFCTDYLLPIWFPFGSFHVL
jgi:hypothetical protein